MKIFNDHADFFCPALNGRLNCSVACTVAPELTQAKCHDSSETAETFKKGLFFSRTKVVSLWVCVDSLWPLFKSLTSSFSPWQWCCPATTFVEVSGNSGAFEKSCSSLDEAYIYIYMGQQSFWHLLLHSQGRKGRNKWLEHSTKGDWNLFYWPRTTSSHRHLFTDC